MLWYVAFMMYCGEGLGLVNLLTASFYVPQESIMRSQFKEWPRCRRCDCKTTRTRGICGVCEQLERDEAKAASDAQAARRAAEKAERAAKGEPEPDDSYAVASHGLLMASVLAHTLPMTMLNGPPRYM